MTAPAVRPVHPSRLEVTQEWIEQYLRNLHTAMPARVQRYDAATQVADLVPLVRHPVPQPDGSYVMEDLPMLPSVPVVLFRTAGWFVSLPIAAGDVLLVVFCERAIGAWWAGDGSPQDPEDVGTHDLSYAVAIPGVYPRSKALAHASGTDMVLGNDSGLRITIKADGSAIELGGSTAFVALANLVANQLNVLKEAINSAGVTPMDGGAAFKAAIMTALAAWPASVASTTAKAG